LVLQSASFDERELNEAGEIFAENQVKKKERLKK